jgi:hypothetical protein
VDQVGSGLLVARLPLAQIRDRVTVNLNFTNPADSAVAYGCHVTQNAGNEVFWAGHNSTSQMRVFRWPENSGSYSWRDVNINSWSNTDYTSQAPDNQYWLPGPLGSGIIGATRKRVIAFVPPGQAPPPNEVWFAWTAGRNTGAGRPHPYIEIARFSDVNLDLVGQFSIFNNDHAYAVPALDADPSSVDVAISCTWGGGGTYYANNAVGVMFMPGTSNFPVGFGLLSTSNSNVTLTASPPGAGCPDVSGGATPNRCSRYGDYHSVRRVGASNCRFSTLGYAIQAVDPALSTDCTVAPGCRTVVNYVEFGSDACLFPPVGPR